MEDSQSKLVKILERAHREESLDGNELAFLLSLEQESEIDAVFEVAREVRSRHFGNRVFLYGFVYISTYCRNHCTFCNFREANELSVRYRRETSEILEAAQSLADSGVHLIDLTLGEDPQFVEEEGCESLRQLIEAVHDTTGLPVMISPGVVSVAALSNFVRAGASWYACYQETHNRSLFKRLRPGQSYDARLETKEWARRLGLLTEEGVLCGVGESARDIADSIEAMRALDCSQVRAMAFVPQEGIPLRTREAPDPLREILTLAVLRLAFPDRLIPATLDVEGLAGLKSRLEAGANVVTSLVPAGFGLAGVAQSSLDIADARRTAAGVIPELEKLGLQVAPSEDYSTWVSDRRRRIDPGSLSLQPNVAQLGG
jgi:methylornithine synthase